jgi:hypothetical protein
MENKNWLGIQPRTVRELMRGVPRVTALLALVSPSSAVAHSLILSEHSENDVPMSLMLK